MKFAKQLNKMIDAGMGEEVKPPRSGVAVGNEMAVIDSLIDDVEELQEDVGQLQEDVTGLQSDVTDLQAADADLKKDLEETKNAIGEITGNSIIPSIIGKYINLSGATADINNPQSPLSPTTYVQYSVVDCSEGDVFTVNAVGGYSPRAYGFLSADGTVLRVAPEKYVCTDLVLTAPANSKYLVINSNSPLYSFVGIVIGEKVKTLESAIDAVNKIKQSGLVPTYVPQGIVWVNKRLDSNGEPTITDTTRAVTRDIISVAGYDRIEWSASAINANDASIAFYDNTGKYISTQYISKSPYSITNEKVAGIRIMFGIGSDINTALLGDDVVITRNDVIRDNVELLPLNIGSKKRIMLIGDSITQGYGSTGFIIYDAVIDGVTYSVRGNGPDYPDAPTGYQVGTYLYTRDRRIWYEALDGDGWAQKLKAYYEAKFNCEVLNYGMSGIDSSDLSSFRNTLILNSNADIVIIMIGTNDRGNTTLPIFFNRLYKTGRLIVQSGKKLILMAPIPASVTNESAFNVHLEDIEHVLYKVAKLLNCKFISMYELFMDYCDLKGITIDSLLADGLHPSDEGYEVMFKLITKELGLNRKRPDATW